MCNYRSLSPSKSNAPGISSNQVLFDKGLPDAKYKHKHNANNVRLLQHKMRRKQH